MNYAPAINKPVVMNWTSLVEDWNKAKSLAEIYALVGKFPFRAKAIIDKSPEGSEVVIPLGTVITLFSWDYRTASGRMLSDWVSSASDKGSNVHAHFKRWALVED